MIFGIKDHDAAWFLVGEILEIVDAFGIDYQSAFGSTAPDGGRQQDIVEWMTDMITKYGDRLETWKDCRSHAHALLTGMFRDYGIAVAVPDRPWEFVSGEHGRLDDLIADLLFVRSTQTYRDHGWVEADTSELLLADISGEQGFEKKSREDLEAGDSVILLTRIEAILTEVTRTSKTLVYVWRHGREQAYMKSTGNERGGYDANRCYPMAAIETIGSRTYAQVYVDRTNESRRNERLAILKRSALRLSTVAEGNHLTAKQLADFQASIDSMAGEILAGRGEA